MMNHISKNQAVSIRPGTVITGKWHKKDYQIIKELGYGALGTVYLADSLTGPVAVKFGHDSMAITSEVNVLKHFSKVQGQALGPSLIEMDDWMNGIKTVPFYVMEYIKGEPLFRFLSRRGTEWLGILMIQLLKDLENLHHAGWVFGDLKPDNVLVAGPPPKIRLLDVGGTTLIGRSIKEYTEFFDRGYWGLGDRKAEASYDLFAVAMVMINAAYPQRFEKRSSDPYANLKKAIEQKDLLLPYRNVMLNALKGTYQSAGEMREDLVGSLYKDNKKKKAVQTNQHAVTSRTVRKKNLKQKRSKKYSILETIVLFTFLLAVYVIYLFGQ
ncbi:serine/threonine protein kinase [Pseudalkalibacillus caeni]|uniref:Protein kinase family protein n=1 Tax=Exobacillus caeni TaxID=2574798 RepID=A0A5R9EXT6_9BACL|nr:protein kinase [Pseudalkalibacillus caeni]TLS34986.1 protein kinase family protein [Pseudalkalibacillus caeni]